MASDDISQLSDVLTHTHIGDGELSYKGLGLKLDDADSVEELVHEITESQDLRALRLEGNTVGVEAAQAIAKALESKDQLQRCYWSDMFTGRLRSEIPTALRSLGSAVMSAGARLTELDLSDNAFGPDGVTGIEQLLKSPSCHTLKELRLNNCGIGIGGGKILAEALMECHRQSSTHEAPFRLSVFFAGRNRLENEGASALAKAFQMIGSLEEVHMPQNGINYPGVMALASAIRRNPQLRVLNLNDNTFTKRGTLVMAQALRHLRNIQVINFGDCLVRSEGAIALAGVLRQGLPVLKELNLSFGEITEAAAVVVAQAVLDKAHMERLDLNGNCLGEEGCEALREAMETVHKGDMLASLSDDEGEPDHDDKEDEEEEEDDNEEVEEEEEEEASGCCDDDDDNKEFSPTKENGVTQKEESPVKAQSPEEIVSFLSCPTAEKLLQLGEMRAGLQQQVDVSEPQEAADVFLKVASLYSEDPQIKMAVTEITDGVLQKLLSASDLHSYCFLSALLVRMGLLKGEGRVKRTRLVPGQLLCLERGVQQDYFLQHHVSLLHKFLSKNSGALKSCAAACASLSCAVEKRIQQP